MMKYQRFYGILVICLCAVLMAGAIVYAISDHAEPQTQDAGQIRTAGTQENGPVTQENIFAAGSAPAAHIPRLRGEPKAAAAERIVYGRLF